jgi:hypothetical protein
MATFVEIQTDAFANNVKVAKEKLSYAGVRRPYRGIEIKQDTYSVIKVMKSDGTEIPLVDAGGPNIPKETNSTGSGTQGQNERKGHASTYNYSNFIIQQIQDSRQEKQQILETFGDSYIFFFGERPRILVVNGLLMNTLDFNWRTEFWYNYENTLRGTKLVEQDARIYLYWDDIVVEGYMIGATAKDDASMPYHIPFSFQLFVTNHMYLSTIGDDDYPITHAVNLQPLLQQTDVEGAKRQLKQQVVAAAEYSSNIEKVRKSLQASEQARVAAQSQGVTGFLASGTGQKLMQGKNLLANALAIGVNAQNLTFLSVVNRLFRARKMRFPKGIGGAASYAGPPQYAGEEHPWGFGPKRKLPYRSKIRHNVDEYVQGAATEAQLDIAAREAALEAKMLQTGYELERMALTELAQAGIDPVQHPGGSLFGMDHALGAFAGAVSEGALLAIGFSVSAGLAAAGQGQQ